MKRFRLLLSFLKGSVGFYLIALILCLISVYVSLYVPIIVKVVIDSIIGNEPLEFDGFIGTVFSFRTGDIKWDLLLFSFISVIIVLFSAVLEFIFKTLVTIASQNAGLKMKNRMYSHIQSLDYEYQTKAEVGDLIQRCTTDIENSMTFLSDHVMDMARTLLTMVFTVTMMFRLSTTMSIVSMSLLPVVFTYSFYFFKRAKRVFEAQEESDAKLSAVLQENLTGVRVVKAFARQDYEKQKFDKVNVHYREKSMGIIRAMSQYWSVSDGLSFLQIGVVLGFGSYFVVSGTFGVGMVVAFFTYVERVMWPVKQLGRLLAESGKTAVSLKRLLEVLSERPEELDDSDYKPQIFGNIEFRDVSFTYPNGTKVLKNVSFSIKQGESVAIIGQTGSGKTTLVQLLQRLYDNYTGEILLDGREIRTINKGYLRESIGLILQEPFLFNRSVKENISYTKEDVEDHSIYKAAEVAAISNTINSFEKGYDTTVGEGGVTLSGGQKQRIAIARTLICKHPVVIFDDSLSAVDTETDRVIRRNMKDGGIKPTSIIISHRVSTVRDADRIIVLEDGVVTANGNHDEIKSKDNLYRRILDIQSEIEKEFHTTFL